jgi:uridine kinase
MIPYMGRVALADIITAFSMRPSEGVRIVGIDGPSGSGKSTLTRRLMDRTNATLVEIDDFVSWTDFAGWWPRFDVQVLRPLVRGEDAHYQVRDWQNDPYGSSLRDWKTAPWAPLVIFDGVTSTRQAVADLLAYRIWVEAPEATRLARGLARDGEHERHLWLAWMQQEQAFFTKDRARERADLRVNSATSSGVNLDEAVVTTLDEPGEIAGD